MTKVFMSSCVWNYNEAPPYRNCEGLGVKEAHESSQRCAEGIAERHKMTDQLLGNVSCFVGENVKK